MQTCKRSTGAVARPSGGSGHAKFDVCQHSEACEGRERGRGPRWRVTRGCVHSSAAVLRGASTREACRSGGRRLFVRGSVRTEGRKDDFPQRVFAKDRGGPTRGVRLHSHVQEAAGDVQTRRGGGGGGGGGAGADVDGWECGVEGPVQDHVTHWERALVAEGGRRARLGVVVGRGRRHGRRTARVWASCGCCFVCCGCSAGLVVSVLGFQLQSGVHNCCVVSSQGWMERGLELRFVGFRRR